MPEVRVYRRVAYVEIERADFEVPDDEMPSTFEDRLAWAELVLDQDDGTAEWRSMEIVDCDDRGVVEVEVDGVTVFAEVQHG